MKITIEALTADDLKKQIDDFFGIVAKKKTKDKGTSVATEEEKESFPVADNSITMTPLEMAIAERAEELDKSAPVVTPIAPTATLTYEDLSKAVMAKVKAKGKADALAILRKFKHKDGSDNLINSAMDVSMVDYATCIAELSK